ncbi:hypothetical protein NX779_00130 [Mycoplasma cottewii]|uniref:Lipoprotein n=1 Tax=Mycoplasma cottewii TaxID=51364 RepID=A0ABY5TWX1_9MOLU|nr:hypothetical protein [Mycoplasma cottewii]UWD35055.1 hypothetical protein NX779_00130 [Mycoplasma cottewii]
MKSKNKIGPKIEKFVNGLKEDQEKEKLDDLKLEELKNFFASNVGKSLSKLLEFYGDSKPFSSLSEALNKLAEISKNKEQSKINFLKHMKEIFEDYKKHENKIDSWIQKFNS